MRIFNPFKIAFRDSDDQDGLQPMIVMVPDDEREKAVEYLQTIVADPLVNVRASGLIVVGPNVMDSAYMIANSRMGYGWYG
jgi:hypothetical protein